MARPTHANWQQARQMWERGATGSEIARRIGVNPAAVYWHRKAHAWTPRRIRGFSLSEPLIARAGQMWLAGATGKVIGAAVGVSESQVYRLAQGRGWPARPRPGAPRPEWVEAREMWDRRAPTREIAAFMGVGYSRVCAFARDHNWPWRGMIRAPRLAKVVRPPREPRARAVRPVKVDATLKGRHPCQCGSRLARLVPINAVYVYRCHSCVPAWWSPETRRSA